MQLNTFSVASERTRTNENDHYDVNLCRSKLPSDYGGFVERV